MTDQVKLLSFVNICCSVIIVKYIENPPWRRILAGTASHGVKLTQEQAFWQELQLSRNPNWSSPFLRTCTPWKGARRGKGRGGTSGGGENINFPDHFANVL